MSVANELSSERAVRRFQETILDAANSGKKLRVRGGDTKRTIYPSINDEANKGAGSLLVDYSGFVSYQAAELVLTVRAGTALTEIETELAAKNQKLGFEPPGFGAGATIGGTVAAALSGSARPYAGSVRDAVLGVKVLSGAGKIARFGGEVMKNVAGYDVSRLLVGSMGSLGVLLEVSLRTTPVPNAESFWTLACDEAEAFRQMATFNRASLPISGLAFNDDSLHVRFSGSQVAVEQARSAVRGYARGNERFWVDLKEQRMAFFQQPENLWRITLPFRQAQQAQLDGNRIWDWGGGLCWLKSDVPSQEVIEFAKQADGSATLFRGDPGSAEWETSAANLAIRKRLRAVFDPSDVFVRRGHW